MASIKKKLDKNGNVVYQVQASNGRGRRVWRTFRPEPTWSSRTVQRELQRFAAELESQLEDREVLTREETIQQAAAQAVEAAKVKTLRQYAGAVYLPEKAAIVSEKTRASYTQLLEQHVFPVLGDVPMQDITAAMLKALLSGLPERFAFASRVKVYAVLHGMFKAAVMDDTLDVNPMDKVPRPEAVEGCRALCGAQGLYRRGNAVHPALPEGRAAQVAGVRSAADRHRLPPRRGLRPAMACRGSGCRHDHHRAELAVHGRARRVRDHA